MRSFTRIALVGLGALALATAPFACDKDDAAAKTADKGAGCPHAAAASTNNGALTRAMTSATAWSIRRKPMATLIRFRLTARQ